MNSPRGVTSLEGRLRLHEAIRFEVLRVGHEQRPVLIVDDFLADPQALIDYAATDAAFSGTVDAFYPGLRAPIPPIYAFALRAFLGERIAATFGLGAASVVRERSHFSLVTTRPERLQPLQRIAHFDNTDERQLALLHYLSPHDLGGTSFYRHVATGFEAITPPRLAGYERHRSAELAAAPPPATYIHGSTVQYEQTACFEARFNRLIVYQGCVLHSADVGARCTFSADPRAGRLTANTFFVYR